MTDAIHRARLPHYGLEVQEALALAWNTANRICAKRLIPFLPVLIDALERHGYLHLSEAVRTDVLTLSPATADRLLRPYRHTHPISTTRSGPLLKRLIPLRTFQDWRDVRAGFMEADLVAHCGTVNEGSFLSTLVLTDVATGWTECLPLLHKSQQDVLDGLRTIRLRLPFPLLGFDTDNGSEFLNAEILSYCQQEAITFTRGRTGRKNDQCFVEQKNGAIVRQIVGYDRFVGEFAHRQLGELYRALRWYINCFQPSMKLQKKHREGSQVHRRYDTAQTPLQRLLATETLDGSQQDVLREIAYAFDPVLLLHQVEQLQHAMWHHAVKTTALTPSTTDVDLVTFTLHAPLVPVLPILPTVAVLAKHKRHYHMAIPRYWRTRPDPFADLWEDIHATLQAHPDRTGVAIFLDLQQRYPGRFPDCQVRTLQRGVGRWRAQALLTFHEGDASLHLVPLAATL